MFSKEHFTDGNGKALSISRPSPREWEIASHDGTVHIGYSVFGNRVDGTFVAIDSTHATSIPQPL